MSILVTGAAGFIGAAVSKVLLENGEQVFGLDNLNPYYSVSLKKARLKRLKKFDNFEFSQIDVADRESLEDLFADHKFSKVIHLAAQAGVRYSLENPYAYIDSNVAGFMNILENCRHKQVPHLVYASSSSVYGSNTKLPFSTSDNVDHPISLYAATKKANELMAHTYSHLYGLPTTGLRFFTVYGPWGRPDMALFKFVKAIYNGEPLQIYNKGDMIRDFTYIDDIVNGVIKVSEQPPKQDPNWRGDLADPATSYAPYKVYNIGNNRPVPLMSFVEAIEKATDIKAKIDFLPMQAGDVVATHADVSPLEKDFNYSPNTSVEQGIKNFIDWYKEYYQVA